MSKEIRLPDFLQTDLALQEYRDSVVYNIKRMMEAVAGKLGRISRKPGNKELYACSEIEPIPLHPPSILHPNQSKFIAQISLTEEMVNDVIAKNIRYYMAPIDEKIDREDELRDTLTSIITNQVTKCAVEFDVLESSYYKAALNLILDHEVEMVRIEINAIKARFTNEGAVERDVL
jgi:hypothetical protein